MSVLDPSSGIFPPSEDLFSSPLTAKQELFIQEYLIDKNATQAAIRAGYSEQTAAIIGHENLRKPNIRRRINEALGEIIERAKVDATWIRERLRNNVERSMQAEPVVDDDGNPIGIYNYQGNVANRALELLGKDQGMFTDKLEVTLNRDSRQVIEYITRLAVECCEPSKRKYLADSLISLRTQYAALLSQ